MHLKYGGIVRPKSRDIICVVVAASKVKQTCALVAWNGLEWPGHNMRVLEGELLGEDPSLTRCLSDELFQVTVYGKRGMKDLNRLVGECVHLEGVTVSKSGSFVSMLLNLSKQKCRISVMDEPPALLMRQLNARRNRSGQKVPIESIQVTGTPRTVPESVGTLLGNPDKVTSEVLVVEESAVQSQGGHYPKLSTSSQGCLSTSTTTTQSSHSIYKDLAVPTKALNSSAKATCGNNIGLHFEGDRGSSTAPGTAIDGHDADSTFPDTVTRSSSSCSVQSISSVSTPCLCDKKSAPKYLSDSFSTTASTPSSGDVQTDKDPMNIILTAPITCSGNAPSTDKGLINVTSSESMPYSSPVQTDKNAMNVTLSAPTSYSGDAQTPERNPSFTASALSKSFTSDVVSAHKNDAYAIPSLPSLSAATVPSKPHARENVLSYPEEFLSSPLILQVTEWGVPTLYKSLPPVIVTHSAEHFKPVPIAQIKSCNPPLESRLVASVDYVFPNSLMPVDFIWVTCKNCAKCASLSSLVTGDSCRASHRLPCPWCNHSHLSLQFLLVLRLLDPSGRIFVFAKGQQVVDLFAGFTAHDVCNAKSLGARHVSQVLSKLHSKPFLDIVLSAYEERDNMVYYKVVRTLRCKPL